VKESVKILIKLAHNTRYAQDSSLLSLRSLKKKKKLFLKCFEVPFFFFGIIIK
jgi:hypothetical protein